ncbi:peptide-binding protein [Desulfopila sp. IMCC35006]|uniref:SH3 domain-containing protein n=1 Tax=Desulfopila sp. IMCC35006 TaxID=2569542 RepID=UPI0010AD65D7|nr:SH3 domain-containing protein [Desulfopila sp. IMCC35006]TKB27374.1 peptide-binding protein [Desulfopila sp. IMCC35006]
MFVEKKKLLKIFLTLGCTCLLTTSPVFAADYLSITTDNANVRTGPGTDYPASMELFQGYPLKVTEKKGDWYKVTDFENDTGWVHDSIVKKADTVIVNAKESINMRSGPSTKDAVVADVERGVVLTKLAEEGQWTKVRHSSGTTGYVYTPLLWP